MASSDLRMGTLVPYLQAWRLYNILDQAELADMAGISAMTVLNGEQGKPLRRTTIGKLARALGVTRQQLVYQQPPNMEKKST